MPAKSKKQPDAYPDLFAFSTDAAAVIAMRCARIAKGGTAGQAEARLMVTEKLEALAHVQWGLLTGAFGFSPDSMARGVMTHYADGVQANRRRLNAATSRRKKSRA